MVGVWNTVGVFVVGALGWFSLAVRLDGFGICAARLSSTWCYTPTFAGF
jgi:hypothetical protein